EITLVVRDSDPPEVWEEVFDGRTDLAIAPGNHPDKRLREEPLFHAVLDHVILPHGHPLAGRKAVGVADLAGLPLLLTQPGPWESERIVRELRLGGLLSPVLRLDGGLRSAHMGVAAGRGWTLMTRQRSSAPPEGAVVVELQGIAIPVVVALCWRQAERRPV